ncbi:MAG: metallophosphoesterase [Chlorobiaceae bacterium]|nr:metallophosphoesterase [Chlorobiaceae bacterium]
MSNRHLYNITKIKYFFLGGIALALNLLFIYVASPAEIPKHEVHQPVLVFVSDTQSPMWIETLKLKSDRNNDATDAIFHSILSEPNVAALFHLGDITAMGSFESEWETIDSYLSLLQDSSISFFPVPGNHDYYIFPQRGREAFLKRFSFCEPSWYVVKKGNIAVVLLNSNFSRLSEEERKTQQQWFESQILTLEQDSIISSIIIGTHYSPFTNSTIVDPSTEVQEAFVPVFLQCNKCKLFLSGHAHAFEHFQKGGKDFVVLGGGGGLLHPLLLGAERRWVDLFPNATERRMFHYILCEQRGEFLNLTVKMLNPDYRSFTSVYEINFEEK